jgi:hypothetical protein
VDLEGVSGRREIEKLALGSKAGLVRFEGVLGRSARQARFAFGGGGAPGGLSVQTTTSAAGASEWRLDGGIRVGAGCFEDFRAEWSLAEKNENRTSSGRIIARTHGLGFRLRGEARWSRRVGRMTRKLELEAVREVSRGLETELVFRRPSGRGSELEATVRFRSAEGGGILRVRLPEDRARRIVLEWRHRRARGEVRASATFWGGTPPRLDIEITTRLGPTD